MNTFSGLSGDEQGWTEEVLKLVRALGKKRFSLSEIYARAEDLRRLHPDNQHVEAKIRQQLQVLRDRGVLKFLDDKGSYELLR